MAINGFEGRRARRAAQAGTPQEAPSSDDLSYLQHLPGVSLPGGVSVGAAPTAQSQPPTAVIPSVPPVSTSTRPQPVVPTVSAPRLSEPASRGDAPKAKKSAGIAAAMRRADAGVDPEFVASIEAVLDHKASDLHLVGDSHPMIRVDGELHPVAGTSVWSPERVSSVLLGLVSDTQLEAFKRDLELDLAYAVDDLARFRVNIYRDRSGLAAAMRIIPSKILSVKELGLPPELVALADLPRGLVLVCGPTGSGKSTTLAAIVDRVNSTHACHILTVEDPIEFLHHHKTAIINQREVGEDTRSFSEALKHALREDPDVILVGEMRDLETISTALTAAETGHLVFATLHTQDAGQTIDRIIDVYPAHQQAQVRTQLAATLKAVVVQTLIPKASGSGRAVATEVMFTNPAIANLVREQKTHQLRTILQSGQEVGMHTLDQDLARLVTNGEIDYEKAVERAQDRGELDQLLKSRGLSAGRDGDPFAALGPTSQRGTGYQAAPAGYGAAPTAGVPPYQAQPDGPGSPNGFGGFGGGLGR